MKLWRVSDFADLSGRGGLLTDARWSKAGTAVVYCADHPATALLEKLVHIDLEDFPRSYQLLAVDVPDDAPAGHVESKDLPDDWKSDLTTTRSIGTGLLRRCEHLIIWVPCALVPYAWNALLNPSHNDIGRCHISDAVSDLFDPRLIR